MHLGISPKLWIGVVAEITELSHGERYDETVECTTGEALDAGAFQRVVGARFVSGLVVQPRASECAAIASTGNRKATRRGHDVDPGDFAGKAESGAVHSKERELSGLENVHGSEPHGDGTGQ
jgi:hypothetical protein